MDSMIRWRSTDTILAVGDDNDEKDDGAGVAVCLQTTWMYDSFDRLQLGKEVISKYYLLAGRLLVGRRSGADRRMDGC